MRDPSIIIDDSLMCDANFVGSSRYAKTRSAFARTHAELDS